MFPTQSMPARPQHAEGKQLETPAGGQHTTSTAISARWPEGVSAAEAVAEGRE